MLRLPTLLGLLRELGAVPAPARSASQLVLAGYREHLLVERRLTVLTAATRADVIRRFLAWRTSGRGELALADLTVADVHAFVLAEASRCTAVRSPRCSTLCAPYCATCSPPG